ncbi:unnamed protein product [Caenorhabditis angaria]|uniref:Protein kinase domain-containing protein n=1 Tax=Caenorhabditis angaria TaxID=860376 RepID=A0A9P1IKH3_9PELO|nr:unnamed protein product [Caenorhabditis angaria]
MSKKQEIQDIFPFDAIPRANDNKNDMKSKSKLEKQKEEDHETLMKKKNNLDVAISKFNSPDALRDLKQKQQMIPTLPQKINTVENVYEVLEQISGFDRKAKSPSVIHVQNRQTKQEFYAKFQYRNNWKGDSIDNEVKVMIKFQELNRVGSSKFLNHLRDCGFNNDFRYIVIDDYGIDLMTLVNTHRRFEAPLIFLITYYSFQSLKNLHSFDIIHRDIRPSSFAIIKPFSLKLKDFYRATEKTYAGTNQRVDKTWRADRFSPRRAHNSDASLDEFDDYEMWLHTMMFLFCESKLPWKSDETMLKNKENFYKSPESFDYCWLGSCDILCLIPSFLKKEISKVEFLEIVDELFSLEAMIFDRKEMPEWNLIEEPGPKRRNDQRTNCEPSFVSPQSTISPKKVKKAVKSKNERRK